MVYIIPIIGRLANTVVEMELQAARRLQEVGQGHILTQDEVTAYDEKMEDESNSDRKAAEAELDIGTVEDARLRLHRASPPTPVSALKRDTGTASRFRKAM